MGWEVTPSNGVRISAPENKNTEIYFPANTTKTDITYTVRFIDGNGDCGSKKITVKSCDDLPCNLKQVEYSQTTVIPAQPGDDYFFLFTYNREGNCQFNIEEVTSYNVIRDWKITEIDDGYNAIAAQINDNTGSKRTFRIKVTLDGSDIGTFDFEQQGTTPGPEPSDLGSRDFNYIWFAVKNSTNQTIKYNAHFFLHFTDGTGICCYKFGHTDMGYNCNKYMELAPGATSYALDNIQFFTSTKCDLSDETKIPEGYDHLRTLECNPPDCVCNKDITSPDTNTLDGNQCVFKDDAVTLVNTTFLNENRNDLLQHYLGKTFDSAKPPRAFAYDASKSDYEVEFKCSSVIKSYYKKGGTRKQEISDNIFRNGYGDESDKHAVEFEIEIIGFTQGESRGLC